MKRLSYKVASILTVVAAGAASAQVGLNYFPIAIVGDAQIAPENAFKQSFQDVDDPTRTTGELGARVFSARWTPQGVVDQPFDGLGPVFNRTSCDGCHQNNGRSLPPEATGNGVFSIGARFLGANTPEIEARYGKSLNYQSVYGVPIEGRLLVSYSERFESLADGTQVVLHEPIYSLTDLGYGPVEAPLSVRIGPPLLGLGLLELVPDSWLFAQVRYNEIRGGSVRGRVSLLPGSNGAPTAIGRFGWKAERRSILEAVAVAFSNDIGVSSFVTGATVCGGLQTACALREAASWEISDGLLEATAVYLSTLRPPSASFRAEELVVFEQVGCAECHVPSLPVRMPYGETRLAAAFTDLLLHDMGPDLAEGAPTPNAAASEWRTSPLWGIGHTAAVTGLERYLHDGRARSLEEAILWHGGEAAAARDSYSRLTEADRDRLIGFLQRL